MATISNYEVDEGDHFEKQESNYCKDEFCAKKHNYEDVDLNIKEAPYSKPSFNTTAYLDGQPSHIKEESQHNYDKVEDKSYSNEYVKNWLSHSADSHGQEQGLYSKRQPNVPPNQEIDLNPPSSIPAYSRNNEKNATKKYIVFDKINLMVVAIFILYVVITINMIVNYVLYQHDHNKLQRLHSLVSQNRINIMSS